MVRASRALGLALGTVTLSLAVTPNAFAEIDPWAHRLELGLAGGAFMPAKDHELFNAVQRDHQTLKAAGLDLALRLGFYPVGFIGAELEGAFVPIKTLGGRDTGIFMARAHGVLQLPYSFTPFVVVGGGAWGMRSGASVVGNDIDPTFHWGAGFKYEVADNLTIRLDGRHIISASQGHGNTSHFEMLSGISYNFGGNERRRIEHKPVPLMIVEKQPEPVIEPVIEQPKAEEIAKQEVIIREEAKVQIQAAFDRVHFTWGSASLREGDHSALDEVFTLLERHPTLRVSISGHTDSTGPERFNMRLSQKRANAVKAYLVRRGVLDERLETRAFGPHEPVRPNSTSEGRAQNRRSDIVVDEKPIAPIGIEVTIR
jgi:outer membrane protein OmpA-like peptidoglycan-associated protein